MLRKRKHDAYENTWKCGELKFYFSPSAGGLKKKRKKKERVRHPSVRCGGRPTDLLHSFSSSSLDLVYARIS